MTPEQLIAKQQLQIETLQQALTERNHALQQINLNLICIGGPLNDNAQGYTKEQLRIFWRIKELCDW